ncbi:MAG TPA: hypothetical protein VG387_20000 [Rhizomicrobium sp.]|nr:hypothetical protein [Rhizomicrobium sp.]
MTHRLVNPEDLSAEEQVALRLIVVRSFMTQTAIPAAARAHLLELGLIQRNMGGLLPTPAGRICARTR